MLITRRLLLAALTVPFDAAAGASATNVGPVFRPEDFGAKGDGATDDSDALHRASRALSAAGGGVLALRPVTYRVGRQRRGGPSGYAFEPVPLIEITGCRREVHIRGMGARLQCAPGLRYGSFERNSGAATRHEQPYYATNELATPYRAMITIEDCTAPVTVAELELDGQRAAALAGGPFGDTGWQIPATGLFIGANHAAVRIAGVASHHHLLDGIVIDSDARVGGPVTLSGVRASDNGRQGLSIVGGREIAVTGSRFERNGRGRTGSRPGAGVDIEAERGPVRSVRLSDCVMSDNAGCGLLAAEGDGSDIGIVRCTMVGTTSWAAWPNRPGMRFDTCTFVGPVVNAFGSVDHAAAARFENCLFTDDPRLAPAGRIYGGDNPSRPIAVLPYSRNALFRRCRFEARHSCVLPWSVGVIYDNCTMTQTGTATSYPRGVFTGINRIAGPADLAGSRVDGAVLLNGNPLRRGPV